MFDFIGSAFKDLRVVQGRGFVVLFLESTHLQ